MTETPQLPKGVVSEGEDAYRVGLPKADCPYPPGAMEREEWLKGWKGAAARDRQ